MISKLCIASAATATLVEAVTNKRKCPFGYGSSETDELVETQASDQKPMYPSQILTCPKEAVMKTETWSKDQYKNLAA